MKHFIKYKLYDWAINHPWYSLWHRCGFYRDVVWAIENYKYRTWIRYAHKRKLWLALDQEFIDKMRNMEIWPRY